MSCKLHYTLLSQREFGPPVLERAVFRGISGEIFALFQACVGNFYTIPPWEVVGTLYLDSSCVTFKYFAFLSVCDKLKLLGHVQAAMMI